MERPTETFGETVRRLRRAAGLTQARAAKLLGRTQVSLSRWETGAVTPERLVRQGVIALLKDECDRKEDGR